MKKNGFTLIELLAVIVILSIILVITTPVITKKIEDVKKGAFRNTVLGITKEAETKITRNLLSNDIASLAFNYEGYVESSIPEGYKLDYRGTKPKSGILITSKTGKVALALHNGTWCAVKGFDEVKVSLKGLTEEECVNEIKPLIIVLNGSSRDYVEINTSYEDPGVVATTIEGEIISNIEVEIRKNNEVVSNIDVSELGMYEIIYKALYDDFLAVAKREVIIQDTMPPTLTIPSNTTITVSEVSTYDFMEGVNVTDNSLEEINVTLTSDITPSPGEYTVIYSAKDSSGNETKKTRYITVIDVGYPTITILGNNPVTINVGTTYTDLGATAVDDVDGDITSKIVTTGTVNNNVVGTYTITYTVSDNAGNQTTKTRTVNVIDNLPPTITFETNGNSTYAKIRSTTVTVSDGESGVNASSLKYIWNTSTTEPSESSFASSFANGGTVTSPAGVTGSYYLWTIAKDIAGNTTIKRSDIFNLDNIKPVITLIGNSNVSINKDAVYNDAGATATDNIDGAIQVTTSGTVNPNIVGSYTITYTAVDSSGNTATPVIRTVNVVDVSAPEITILGNNPATVAAGTPYTDAGATAHDDVDGNITNKLITTGTVNINIPGTYTITYSVTDNAGNKATATRTVNVVDSTPPTIVFGTNGNTTYAKTHSSKVTVTDNIGLNTSSLKYLWNMSATQPSENSFVTSFTSGDTISTTAGLSGGYYLWILAKDTAGNTTIKRSNVFNLDNMVPIVTDIVINATNIKSSSLTITRSGNATDIHSGLAVNPYIYQRSINNSTWTNICTNNSTSCNFTGLSPNTTYYYRICTNDLLGHQSCTTSKSAKTVDEWLLIDTTTYSAYTIGNPGAIGFSPINNEYRVTVSSNSVGSGDGSTHTLGYLVRNSSYRQKIVYSYTYYSNDGVTSTETNTVYIEAGNENFVSGKLEGGRYARVRDFTVRIYQYRP